MPARTLPLRPNLEQLKRQAKDLLRAIRRGDPEAIADVRAFHPHPPAELSAATLADAQFVLARSYEAPTWPRLQRACRLLGAIWEDRPDDVVALIERHPELLHESATIRNSHWGPPMSFAANLGRGRIIRALHALGATDHEHAGGRAALHGHVGTARMLYELAGRPELRAGALGGPAYTLNLEGTAFLISIGARVVDEDGRRLAPVDIVLQTDSRKPAAKHAILELYAAQGLVLPDTPTMALHRGRLDLLEAHLARDPALLTRTFAHREIYPADMGCGDPIDAVCGTPLDGTALVHMAIEFDEMDVLAWLLERGADPDVRSAVGASGFGGYTPLFGTVVSQPNFWMNYRARGPFEAPVAETLLSRGVDPNVRASLWKQLGGGHDPDRRRRDYRDVTPLSWGRRFHAPIFVSEPALRAIEAAGGRP